MKTEKTSTIPIKYLLTTHRNALGYSYFTAERVRPWYLPNVKVGKDGFPSDYDFFCRESALDAIKSDAEGLRRKPLQKYKIVVVEPIEA